MRLQKIAFKLDTTLALFLFSAHKVFAQNTSTTVKNIDTSGDINSIKNNIKYIRIADREGDLVAMIVYLLNQAIALIGIIAVIFLIIGGFQYITAGGDDSKTEKANKTIINALVGLAIVLLSGVVVQFLIDRLIF